MARCDQLEIVAPNGVISFHDLDPEQGITNIGSDPENDIIVDGSQVAPFLATIDHRQRPYQIILLDQTAALLLDGQPLEPNLGRDLQGWSTIELDGYSMVLVEHASETGAGPVSPDSQQRDAALGVAAAVLAGASTAMRPFAPGVSAALSPQRLSLPPADHLDDIIVVEMAERAWTVDCEQPATFSLTLVNGGNIVAAFNIALEGLDSEWVLIEPASMNLNEGERATANIALVAPRTPASRAGTHHFAVVVTSPNHPGHFTRLGATLVINPFYDFAVSDLSPRQNQTGWRTRTAVTAVTLNNKGNSEALYRVDGEDDQRGCAFEFQAQGQGSGRSARQLEVRLAPDSGQPVSIFVTPTKRRLFGFRKHGYSLTVTSIPLSGLITPRSVLGQLQAAPLLGPWILLLLMALMAAIAIWLFHPYIDAFRANTDSILGGQNVTLNWGTSPFVRLKLIQETTTDGVATEQEVGSVTAPAGSQTLSPPQSVRYRLVAGNLLSDLLPLLVATSEWVPVDVQPVPPKIEVFDTVPITRTVLVLGESANLIWRVFGADKLTLVGSDGLVQSLIPTDTGSINVIPASRTKYTLGAINRYGTAEPRQVEIAVVTPTPTPVPDPVIVQFDVQPRVITAGQSINISWEVIGSETVQIVGIPGAENYPPRGSLQQSPPTDVDYQLIARNGPAEAIMGPFHVTVNPAPPPPQPPVINLFASVPDEVVKGSVKASAVTLQWQVSGTTTDITLSGPDLDLRGLPTQGDITIAAEKTAIYILTAINGPVNSVKTTQIKVLEPTPTPIPPPTPTPLPPPPIIEYFKAESATNDPNDVVLNAGAGTSTTLVYTVVAGSNVKFSWLVLNTTLLLFDGQPMAAVNGTADSIVQNVKAAKTYELRAANTGPIIASRFVQVAVRPKDPPPPPYNVSGVYSDTPPTLISWEYSSSDADRYKVTGFRVYRANVPEYQFTRVAEVGLSPTQWADPLNNPPGTLGCDKAYYVVALTQDVDGLIVESAPSTNSWYSPPCP
jgi:hypothetical protein